MQKNISLKTIAAVAWGLTLSLSLASCKQDPLELSPIDYYGSGNYWKTPAQASAYVVGLHNHFRTLYWTHTMAFGELRGGTFDVGNTSPDGMSLSDGVLRLQTLKQETPATTNFADYFGHITQCNVLLNRIDQIPGMDEAEKNFYKAQALGLRAWYYFDLYRIYGGVPLRLGTEVVDGVLDPNKLYQKRNAPKEIIAQVTKDLEESYALFGDRDGFAYYGQPKKAFWSKAATEALMADVALWKAKSPNIGVPADPTQIAVAKQHLLNLSGGKYGLKLMDDFGRLFGYVTQDGSSVSEEKGNSEVILAWRFQEGESTNAMNNFLYDMNTGQTKGQYRKDGTPWNDPYTTSGGQRYLYDFDLFNAYDDADSRKLVTFFPAYTKEGKLFNIFLNKKTGKINAQGNRVFDSDYIIYRLAWVYLSLAEVANYEGNNADVEKYINIVRERAYGENWDAKVYGYKAGNYTQNELAILAEKDKEFVQEGQRWFDLLRMTYTKGGDRLVFFPQANRYQNDGQPVLNKATEAYKVLWPVDKGLLDNDKTIKQTPGYETGENTAYEGDWN